MPFKVFFHCSHSQYACESLGAIGSFETPFGVPSFIESAAMNGEYDIYIGSSLKAADICSFFAVVLIEPNIEAECHDVGPVVLRQGIDFTDSVSLTERLHSAKAEKRRRKPSQEEPFVPQWVSGVLSNCFVSPSAADAVDWSISDERRAALAAKVKSWDFTSLLLSRNDLLQCSYLILMEEAEMLRLEPERMKGFLLHLEANYRANSYHNFRHAVDVLQSVSVFVSLAVERDLDLKPLERFALLLAAIAHDVGHFGFKNKFVIDSQHPLAVLYNDRSPVENYHCLLLFALLEQSHCRFSVAWDGTMWRTFRKIVTLIILATDMVHHGDHMKRYKALVYNTEFFNDEERRLLVLVMLLKASDLSNVIRPFPLAERWGSCLQYEFYHQVPVAVHRLVTY